MRTKETTPTQRGRVEATQRARTRLARLFFLFFFLNKSNGQERQFLFQYNYVIFPPVSFHFAIQPFE